MTYSATISSKGQITLPADIRRSLKLHPGDKITIVKHSGHAELKPDSYNAELSQLRAQAKQQMQRNGTWGLPWKEVKKRADKARADYYKEKYGPVA